MAGRADEIERALAQHAARQDALFAKLSRPTGRAVADNGAERGARQVLDAPDAVSLGYADVIEAR